MMYLILAGVLAMGLGAYWFFSRRKGAINLRVGDSSASVSASAVSADSVFIQFRGVVIQPEEGERLEFEFESPKTLEIKDVSPEIAATVLNEQLAPGRYSWIRLSVNAESNTLDSYVVSGDKQQSLYIPSGSQSGLKLNSGFTVKPGGGIDATLLFDMDKNLKDPVNGVDYVLKPTLKFHDNEE